MSCVGAELLNRLGLVRSYILRDRLSCVGGPTYRRDLPGDIWGTRTKGDPSAILIGWLSAPIENIGVQKAQMTGKLAGG
jgi:hypothetical protein